MIQCFGRNDLIPIHPPLSKGGNLSPHFGKGRLGGILQGNFKQLIGEDKDG
jgi:hypothetical protein